MKTRFTIYKFDPEHDTKPHAHEYELSMDPRETVFMALIRIRESLDPDLAFRYACNARKCGECGLLINKKVALACDERVQQEQTIKPLPFFPVIKDLVVDTEAFLRKTLDRIFKRTSAFETSEGIPVIDLDTLKKYLEPTQCMGCLLCQASCPLVPKTKSKFSGPFPLLALSQIALDPRWEGKFDGLAKQMGVQTCTECRRCAKACPQHIDLPTLFLRLFDQRREK